MSSDGGGQCRDMKGSDGGGQCSHKKGSAGKCSVGCSRAVDIPYRRPLPCYGEMHCTATRAFLDKMACNTIV